MRNLFIALLLTLPTLAFSQQQLGAPPSVGTTQFGGFDDTDSPNTLLPYEAQALLNVESNINATAIKKRSGFVAQQPVSCSTCPVTGAYYFIDKNGNQQAIVCEGQKCEHSVNNGSFSILTTTATAGVQRWMFVDYNGLVYAVDDKNDQPWSYDGTTFTQPFSTSAPLGSIIESSKDRLILSGVATNPNGVYYSQSGVFTNFTTNINSADPWVDTIGTSGDKVTGLKYDSGNLYIFKRQSITLCILADQFTTSCYPISNTIGTNSPASIVSAPDGIYFQSQNKDYWRIPTYGLYGLELISRKISKFTQSQPSQFGNSGNNLQAAPGDWQAGTQSPANSWNTTTIPGSIFDSSITFTDVLNSTTAIFNATFYSSSSLPGIVSLTSNTWQDTLSTGSLNILPTTWTITTGGFSVSAMGILSPTSHCGAGTNCQINNSLYTTASNSANLSTGTWKFTMTWQDKDGSALSYGPCISVGGVDTQCARVIFAEKNSTNYYYIAFGDKGGTTNQYLTIGKVVSGVDSEILQSGTTSFTKDSDANYIVTKTSNNLISLYNPSTVLIASVTDSSLGVFNANPAMIINSTTTCTGASCSNWEYASFSKISFLHLSPFGTYTGPQFNTSFSTAIISDFQSIISSGTTDGITFQQEQSKDGVSWSSPFAITSNSTSTYWRYLANFNTTQVDTITQLSPTLQQGSVIAATTGQLVTQCIQPGPNITSYGTLVCSNSNQGNGTEVFYATSAASCAALPTTFPINGPSVGWTSQTNNSALTISTNVAFEIGIVSSLTVSTDVAQINTCATSWNNGVTPQPVFGVFSPTKNSIYWSTANNSLGTNNRMLKYDFNLSFQNINPWFEYDVPATAMKVINSNLFFGSSLAGQWNKFTNTNSDNGVAINAYWQSKDFSCNAPYQDSSWQKTFAVVRNQNAGTLTQTFTDSLGDTDVYTLSQATGTLLNYVRANHYIPTYTPSPFANLEFSDDTINNPFEVNGFNLDCFAQPVIIENP